VGNNAQFLRFWKVAGAPELAADERFAINRNRVQNRVVLVPQIERSIWAKPSKFWLTELEREGVPCGPINSVAYLEYLVAIAP
jgi:crotonobetainyl-CoA:carnitine CoA-transferase CaiB-like acyl-CoA transferase